MFCRSLFVFLLLFCRQLCSSSYFDLQILVVCFFIYFLLPLCSLSVDLQILVVPLISSHSSCILLSMFSSRICINYLTLDAKKNQQSINQTNKMVVRQHVALVTDDKIMTFDIQVLTKCGEG